ncbi:peptidase C14 [Dendrothele bispora CBS 962.96]|uniref:Peptidase C14 n=1 Tax=Dendrothele bispora (strain CBS 962.96) TaxID=1314807 RepID=A0A4V4HG79_DENBC|nr:peptidase C14 [Dendrothele bispora CBS 962.96]
MKIGHLAPRRRRQYSQTEYVASNVKSTPKKRALLVGISYPNSPSKLKGPHNDVRVMRNLLMEKYNYQPNDITVLIDDGKAEKKDLQPTKNNLLRELDRFIVDAKRGDHFFFHYAGHVHQGEEDPESKEEDKREEYLVPCDANPDDPQIEDCIQDDRLKELLVNRLPLGAYLVAVFDSCHSQSLLDLDHWRCNRVYVPWISKGRRKSDSMWNNVQRKAAIRSRTIRQNTRLDDGTVQSRKTSMKRFHFDPDSSLNNQTSSSPQQNQNQNQNSRSRSQSHPHPRFRSQSNHDHDHGSSSNQLGHAPSTSTSTSTSTSSSSSNRTPSLTHGSSSLSSSSSSSFSQTSARLYSPPSTPKPPASLSLRTDFVSEPLVPTVPNTPTSPKAAKTVTFTLSPTATINSVSHTLRKATGIVKRKSTSLAPASAPNNKSGTVTMEKKKKKGTLETVDSVFTPWLTGEVRAWNTEDIIRASDSNGRRPEDDEQQQLPEELYLVDSPVQEYCGGDCREKLDKMFDKLTHDNRRGGGGGENHAMEDSFEGSGQVVSLSSCRDNQLAWESTDGKSMTQFLVEQLRKQSHPSFAQLMTTLSHDIHKAAVGMHQQTKGYKREMKLWRKEKNKAKSRSTSDTNGLEMTNFQNPELSSRKPLDMKTRWNP